MSLIFIGQGSIIPGVSLDDHAVSTELGTLHGQIAHNWAKGSAVDILLRPDDITLSSNGGIQAQVEKRLFSGSATLYTLKLPTGSCVESLLPSHHNYDVGETLNIEADVEHLVAFARNDS